MMPMIGVLSTWPRFVIVSHRKGPAWISSISIHQYLIDDSSRNHEGKWDPPQLIECRLKLEPFSSEPWIGGRDGVVTLFSVNL